MDWQIATQTHRGNVRNVNEDALLVVKDYPLLVVADGMGGHLAGEVASGMIVQRLATLPLDSGLSRAKSQVEASLLETNTQILDFASEELAGVTVGSTVVAMLADDSRGVCLWAGDSRLYRLRDGELSQLTEDHSYVAELVREGLVAPEAAKQHPSANMITRAIGVQPSLSVASMTFDIRMGDTYLLCSDGLYNEVEEGEIASLLLHADVYRGSVQLLNMCLGRAAKDNVTFVIAHAGESSGDLGESDKTLLDPVD